MNHALCEARSTYAAGLLSMPPVPPSTPFAAEVGEKIAAAPLKVHGQTLHVPSQSHMYMEPQTAVAVSSGTELGRTLFSWCYSSAWLDLYCPWLDW